MKFSTACRKAAKLIDAPEKWCRFSYSNNGRYCAVGAIMQYTTTVDFGRLCSPCLYLSPWGVPEFNDDPDTTHDDVLFLLFLMAEAAESEGL